MSEPQPDLSARQVAARLGVKIETVYAYVSRGLISRSRDRGASAFDPIEVEAFAVSRQRKPPIPESTLEKRTASGSPLMVLRTDIAHVEDDELFYRDRPVSGLVDSPFEEVVAWLWQYPMGERDPLTEEVWLATQRALRQLPPSASYLDQLRLAVSITGSYDVLRHDSSPDNLFRIGWRLLQSLPCMLGDLSTRQTGSIAARFSRSLGADKDDGATVAAINAALVLLIDHDLAVSSFAARVAASARADGYAVVQAALGAFDSPLHGAAPRAAGRLLSLVLEGSSPEAAIAETTRMTGMVNGFGQPLYNAMDQRAALLLPMLNELPDGPQVLDAVARLSDFVTSRIGLKPNIDLALAALAAAARIPPDAAVTIFALGRMAGWVSHAHSEYDERPMRLRPHGNYVGP